MVHLTRRFLVAGAASAATTGRLAAEPAAPVLPFVVIGDWGRRGAQSQREVGVALGQAAAAGGSRFTISVGDNFYEDGVTGLDDPQWAESFERIYDAPSLQSPWFSILGNHDYRGDVTAQLQYGGPRWTMPARYYDRRHVLGDGTTADFFFIDTSPFVAAYRGTKVRIDGEDTAAQLAWLDGKLAASTVAWRTRCTPPRASISTRRSWYARRRRFSRGIVCRLIYAATCSTCSKPSWPASAT